MGVGARIQARGGNALKKGFLTKTQLEALEAFNKLDGVAFFNSKQDGFDQLRASHAIALLSCGAAAIDRENRVLYLTSLGKMLSNGVPESPVTPEVTAQL